MPAEISAMPDTTPTPIERLSAFIESLAVRVPFRIFVAVALVAFHLFAIRAVAKDRYGHAFNSNPGNPPEFSDASHDFGPQRWNRLIVSRWDSEHYISLAMRLYSHCKAKQDVVSGEFPDMDVACDLQFYPGYAIIGRAVARMTKLPVDYALFGVSLLASCVFFFLWTSREMVRALGLRNVYVSLLILAAFASSYSFVAIGTEPCALAFTLGAFLSMCRGDLLLGALFAGAATGMRISGIGIGAAYAAAVLVLTWQERPPWQGWLARAPLPIVSFWGVLGMMGYHWHRFGDALVYFHAHERGFSHKPNLVAIFFPKGTMVARSIVAAPQDFIFIGVALLAFALGHKSAMRNFSPSGKAFWYVLFAGVLAISMVGSVEMAYAGMTRYLILALPLFFSMAALLSRHTLGLTLWVLFSLAHFWNVELCGYLSRDEQGWEQKCNFSMYH